MPDHAPAQPSFVAGLLQVIPDSTWQWRHGYAEMKVPSANLLDAATFLQRSVFDYLSVITEVDWQDQLELIYRIFAYDYATQPMGAILRCDLPRDGTAKPYRYNVRPPSFVNLTCLSQAVVGHKLADAVAILGSFDIVMGEVDR